MERRNLKKYIKLLLIIQIYMIMLFSAGFLRIPPAHAFFEEQVKYGFEHRWLPMLADTAPEKRFQAMQAFLTYPEWGLPVLRNSIKTPESDNHSWQIAMLIGMLGDASDIPLLLTRWRKLDKHERSEVWLGAMQRLYWKNYVPSEIIPKLKSLSVKYSKNVAEGDKDSNKSDLLYEIVNPAPVSRLIRVTLQFWQTRIQEKLPTEYFLIPAGGLLKTTMPVRILPVAHTKSVRLDFRIWEVGVSEPLLHRTVSIPSTGF